jgi:hypothetical protein
MPVVLRYRGFRFFFYAHEGNPREPAHIHVRRGGGEAKFWLRPSVAMSYNRGLPATDIADLEGIVRDNREMIERVWDEFFRD